MRESEFSAPNRATSSISKSPCSLAPGDRPPGAGLDWGAFMSRTRGLLQNRSPKVRNAFLLIDVPITAADSDVTSEQRTELFLALLDVYALHRDRPSKLAMHRAGEALLTLETSVSSCALVDTIVLQRASKKLLEEAEQYGESLDLQRGVRKQCAGLYSWACMLLRLVLKTDSEDSLRASGSWKTLIYMYARICDLQISAEPIYGHLKPHPFLPPRIRCGNTQDRLHRSIRRTAIMTILESYQRIPLLFESLAELATWPPTAAPSLSTLDVVVDACLYVGKKKLPTRRHAGRKMLRRAKPFLLNLYATRIAGADSLLPKRAHDAFHAFLYVEVCSADLESQVLPALAKQLDEFPLPAFQAASALLDCPTVCWRKRRAIRPTDRSWRSVDNGLNLNRNDKNNGRFSNCITQVFLDKLYSGYTSANINLQEAAMSLGPKLELNENMKYRLLETVLEHAHPCKLRLDSQRDGLYKLFQFLPSTIHSANKLAEFVQCEDHAELLRLAISVFLGFFRQLPTDGELPAKMVPALLAKLQANDPMLRIVTLNEMRNFAFHCTPSPFFASKSCHHTRIFLLGQLLPALEKCLMLGARSAHFSSEAALEACTALRILLYVPEEFSTARTVHALRTNPVLQQPLRAKPEPSFLLDTRVNHPAVVSAMGDVLKCRGAGALKDPNVKDLFFRQMLEHAPYDISYTTGELHLYDPMLSVELINYTAWGASGSGHPTDFDLLPFIVIGVEDYGGYEDWLPRMIVSAHVSGKSGPENTAFEEICEAEHIDAHEQVSTRVDEYLAEIDAAARDPMRAEAAAAAYSTVLHLAPEAVLSRTKKRL